MRALLLLFAICAPGQDVPPPPKPGGSAPTLADTLASLKQMLLSSGDIQYGFKNGKAKAALRRYKITDVVADPEGCSIRIRREYSTNGDPVRIHTVSYFFETMNIVEALNIKDIYERNAHASGTPLTMTYTDSPYAVVMDGYTSAFMFRSAEEAINAADAVLAAAKTCRELITPNAAAGTPGLDDTSRFIVDKLTGLGLINFRQTLLNADGSTQGNATTLSVGATGISMDTATCQLRYQQAMSVEGAPILPVLAIVSFRRVETLEVSTEENALNVTLSPNGGKFSVTPTIYRLTLRVQDGNLVHLRLRDEDTANRLAKAMTHATELCGGGKKEPF